MYIGWMTLHVFEHNFLTCNRVQQERSEGLVKQTTTLGENRTHQDMIKSKNCSWCLDHSVSLTWFHLIVLINITPRFSSVIHGIAVYTRCMVELAAFSHSTLKNSSLCKSLFHC